MRAMLAALVTAASAAPAADRVQRLPGWPGELLSKFYAGYVGAGTDGEYTMYEHYLFFESEGDPTTDPVIMWTNGGPGAPSLFGSFTELGPYYLSDASLETEDYKETGVPSLMRNVQSWTKQASLLIRNLPPPVGYSYCEPAGPAGDGYSCGAWNDTRTVEHSYEFLNNWFEAFPEYSDSDLYLTGESYAGIYVPTLAREILAHKDSVPAKALKGFAVGDGVVGPHRDGHSTYFHVEFYHGHGQFSTKTYNEIKTSCSGDELFNGPVTSSACTAALNKMDDERGYVYGYGLYDECYDFDLSASRWDAPQPFGKTPKYERHSMDGFPCGGSGVLSTWAKHAVVKEALHVAANATYFSGDNGAGFDYNVTESRSAIESFYKHAAQQTKLRVLIYNGDADPGINSFRTENFTVGLGLKETEAWRPWTIDGQMRMGGYVTRYEGDLDYLTIRGSGHMVPMYKPEAASAFLKAWLANDEYPRLQKPKRSSRTVV